MRRSLLRVVYASSIAAGLGAGCAPGAPDVAPGARTLDAPSEPAPPDVVVERPAFDLPDVDPAPACPDAAAVAPPLLAGATAVRDVAAASGRVFFTTRGAPGALASTSVDHDEVVVHCTPHDVPTRLRVRGDALAWTDAARGDVHVFLDGACRVAATGQDAPRAAVVDGDRVVFVAGGRILAASLVDGAVVELFAPTDEVVDVDVHGGVVYWAWSSPVGFGGVSRIGADGAREAASSTLPATTQLAVDDAAIWVGTTGPEFDDSGLTRIASADPASAARLDRGEITGIAVSAGDVVVGARPGRVLQVGPDYARAAVIASPSRVGAVALDACFVYFVDLDVGAGIGVRPRLAP